MKILDEKSTVLFEQFIDDCNGLEYDTNLIKLTLSYNRKNKVRVCEDEWYKTYNFDIYNREEYLADLWDCWVSCSRLYLQRMRKDQVSLQKSVVDFIKPIRIIYDVGCGIGYTTAALKELFGCEVIGTNIDSKQKNIANIMAKRYSFHIEDRVSQKADLVFASEYFEHFEKPIDHLRKILDITQPKFIIVANSFTTKAIGHFDEKFTYCDNYYTPKDISLEFRKQLSKDYTRVKIKVWNGRPELWVARF